MFQSFNLTPQTPLNFPNNDKMDISFNGNYEQIIENFIKYFRFINTLNVLYTEKYYDTNCSLNLMFINGTIQNKYKINNFNVYKNIILNHSIKTILYNISECMYEFIGAKTVVISINGNLLINSCNFNIISTIIIKIQNFTPKITNHMIRIYK
ncbi:hypothetical protein QLL95_gp0826 [Cotonvirus japonicus]|uniref:NTF2 domain-containing protein n=1 Tax=Cotonvirus japonicus TaxID=2811091 RepID=A0ABM7NT90_9VIRU|nr:hypothetical protein QLL95_gp0826 [Cotonvirus japonicus]BCS83297.1 hypothetical protein [Cotonvirus japonicus]